MSNQFIGEIRMFAGNFAPAGWAFCDGQMLSIAEYETLFFLIGTTYGGDGQTTFALPDLRGRIPIHNDTTGGSSYPLAGSGGQEQVLITSQTMPNHSHVQHVVAGGAERRNPKNGLFAVTKQPRYAAEGTGTPLDSQVVGTTGGSQPHNNMQPYLCVSFIISLFGIFPPPS
jgi:microcystin-dependent protein